MYIFNLLKKVIALVQSNIWHKKCLLWNHDNFLNLKKICIFLLDFFYAILRDRKLAISCLSILIMSILHWMYMDKKASPSVRQSYCPFTFCIQRKKGCTKVTLSAYLRGIKYLFSNLRFECLTLFSIEMRKYCFLQLIYIYKIKKNILLSITFLSFSKQIYTNKRYFLNWVDISFFSFQSFLTVRKHAFTFRIVKNHHLVHVFLTINKIQIWIWFGIAKLLNIYLKTKISPHAKFF